MDVVDAKDFAYSSFKVTIARVQQTALDVANAPVPCPADQLALINSKKTKGKSMSLGLQQWSTNNSKCHKSQGCFCLLLFVHQTSVVELRKFEVIELADAQDGWKIETRRRMSGKMKGQNYKVYISPDGTKYYSLTQACKNGFQASAEHDGRTTRRKKAGNMRKKK